MATGPEVRAACRRNDADCYQLARTIEPLWARAQVWVDVLMDTLTVAPKPVPIADVYFSGRAHWGLPPKTMQRAIKRQVRHRGDCVVWRRLYLDGVRGSHVLVWTKKRWATWKTATWKETEPQSPSRLREYILRKAARPPRTVNPLSMVSYTCAGCGLEFKKFWRSTRKTCSSTCRKRVHRMSHRSKGHHVTPV